MKGKENKNIDQFFKDRLQGMEATPPPVVWDNIQEALVNKKQDRKVIPLWWKLGGVAAALVLLFAVGNLLFSDASENLIIDDHQLVIEDTTVYDLNDTSEKEITPPSNDQILEHSENKNQDVDDTSLAVEDTSLKEANEAIKTSTKKAIKPNNIDTNLAVANNKGTSNGNSDNIPPRTDYKVNSNDKMKDIAYKDTPKNVKEQLLIDKNISENIIENTTAKEAVAETNSNENKKSTDIENNTIIDKQKSIFDAIEEQKEAVAKTEDELPASRWAISPNVAPVYYNSLSEGSSIDPSFSDNTQNGEVNVSYGVNVSYAVSPRLTVRSGINNVNLSYATGGLELATGDASAALQAVTYEGNGVVVTAVDQGVLDVAQPEGSPYANLTRKATEGDVFLTQSISYTEIPAELTYKLINKRFSVNVIGGFSTLLLGNNEVSVSAGDFNDVLGEANNLNEVSFSTNVGLGFNYRLTKKFAFNLEPMFKYQLNPYTDNSVQFKPYYVGVYSGLSFKF